MVISVMHWLVPTMYRFNRDKHFDVSESTASDHRSAIYDAQVSDAHLRLQAAHAV